MKQLCVLVMSLGSACALLAQTSTGNIQGIVTDPSGAPVPGAAVTARNQQTGIASDVTSNGEGRFFLPFLQPGSYELTVQKAGFARFAQSGIRLEVQQDLSLDVPLRIGDTSSTVEVNAAPVPLSTADGTVGTNIENKKVVDLPLNGRNVLSLAQLVPGVTDLRGSAGSLPQWYSPSLGGGRVATSEVLVDGASLSVTDPTGGTQAFGGLPPSVDAVEEFTVQVNALDAEYGRSGGGVINVATKQGTNSLHGTLREFLRNSALDANDFFANRAGLPLASFKRNQFGFSFGGPVMLPKLYDGRNRTFFFVDWEHGLLRTPAVRNQTVPISAWEQGDFSGLKTATGSPITIYDPLTIHQTAAGNYVRSAFPGNRIPVERFDPVARNALKYYPSPNAASQNPFTPVNNFFVTKTNSTDTDNLSIRIDHSVSDKWRTYARFNRYSETNAAVNYWGNNVSSTGYNPIHRYFGVWDNTFTLAPTLIANFRYGISRFDNPNVPLTSGFDSTALGFPSYLGNQAQADLRVFPTFSISGLASLSSDAGRQYVPTSHDLSASVTKVLSKHTIKAGVEYKKFFLNFWQSTGASNGTFSFASDWTQSDPTRGASNEGFGFASFLLGLGSGTQSSAPVQAVSSNYFGSYLQDNIRVTSKLTLNLGLRYDVDIPRTERYNRMSYFDLSAPSPIAGKVPGFPNLQGAMQFVNDSNRHQTPTDANNFGPRFGFAYQINNKTVVRGGYGLMYGTSVMQAAYHNAGFEGYRTSTTMITSIDGRTPLNYLSNPFPTGFQLPLGPTPGPVSGVNTDLGKTVSESWFIDYVNPVIQQWNLNAQRELPGSFLVEVGYIGNKGNHLQDGENLFYDQLDPKYMALGNALNDLVPNPFYGIITDPTSILSRPTVIRSQLLRPYPQYTGLNPIQRPMANSLYHAVTVRLQKRFSQGLSLLAAYTGGKLISDGEFGGFYSEGGNSTTQNVYDRKSDRALDTQDVSSRLALSLDYELPFGRNRAFFSHVNRAVDFVLGGWQINTIVTFQSGLPVPLYQAFNNTGIGSGGQRPNSVGRSANISGGSTAQRLNQWFDVSAFTVAAPFTFGNAPRTLPDVREPGLRNVDLSIFKNFSLIQERLKAQLRAEAFNAFNTPQFDRANSTIGSPAAGTISAVRVSPRQIQLAWKFIF